MIICVCRRVSDRDIERALRAGASSFEEVQLETGAGTCCGRCGDCARALVDRAAAPGRGPATECAGGFVACASA